MKITNFNCYLIIIMMIFMTSCSNSTEMEQVKKNINSIVNLTQGKKEVDETPLTESNYLNSAFEKQNNGDLEGAIEDYTRIIKMNPKSITALNNRGVAKRKFGNIKGAIADFTAIIKFNPKTSSAYLNRGDCKSDRNQYAEAIKDYNLALKYNPKSGDSYFNRGLARIYLGQNKEAVKDFEQAIKYGSGENKVAYHNIAVAKAKLGKYDEARVYYEMSK